MLQKIINVIRDIVGLIMEIIQLIIGTMIFVLIASIGIIYTLMKHIYFFDYSLTKQLRPIIRSLTLAFDGWANASAGELLNDIEKPIIRFGKWYYTISATYGINHGKGKDLKARKYIDAFFRVLGEKNHCERAITPEQRKYHKLKKK